MKVDRILMRVQVKEITRQFTAVPIQSGKKTEWMDGEQVTIELEPVDSESDKNHINFKFWNGACPAGNITLRCISQEIAENFELGKFYNLTFTDEVKQ